LLLRRVEMVLQPSNHPARRQIILRGLVVASVAPAATGPESQAAHPVRCRKCGILHPRFDMADVCAGPFRISVR
jgi:hypothetical protein